MALAKRPAHPNVMTLNIQKARPMRLFVAAALCLAPLCLQAEEIGRVGVDWVGNDIIIEAIPDPKVQGVTCHISYFERSMWDRLSKGNWFEDPSNASIACRQTGPIQIGAIDKTPSGEAVFSESRSLIFKSLNVTRIFDQKNQVLIYLTHATELTDGSAKMSISTVPLYNTGQTKTP
ncbi:MAG: CreA protein [Rhodobacteraceae bacterium]|nr:MAG: CreA protein [Paracoccaceae bacterium]